MFLEVAKAQLFIGAKTEFFDDTKLIILILQNSAKCIAIQILVIPKLNGRKDFILRGFICDVFGLSKDLPVQSKYLKHTSKV